MVSEVSRLIKNDVGKVDCSFYALTLVKLERCFANIRLNRCWRFEAHRSVVELIRRDKV